MSLVVLYNMGLNTKCFRNLCCNPPLWYLDIYNQIHPALNIVVPLSAMAACAFHLKWAGEIHPAPLPSSEHSGLAAADPAHLESTEEEWDLYNMQFFPPQEAKLIMVGSVIPTENRNSCLLSVSPVKVLVLLDRTACNITASFPVDRNMSMVGI